MTVEPPAVEFVDVPVGVGASRNVTWTDADGTTGTLAAAGGTATVRFTGTGLSQAPAGRGIAVSGTNVEVVAITATGGAPAINVRGVGGNGELVVAGISGAGAVRGFSGRNVVLRGTSDLPGGIGRLDVLRTEGATITLGGANAAIRIGAASDTDLTAAGAVRQLRVGSWGGAGGDADVITAPAVGTLQSTGAFAGNVNVSGPVNSFKVGGDLSGAVTAGSIRSLRAGSMSGAAITLTQALAPGVMNLNSLNVTGAMLNSSVRSSGSLGSVTVGNMTNSSVFAGVNEPSGAVVLPDAADDFVPGVSIRAVNVRNRAAPSFVSSFVAAGSLGRLNLGVVQTANGGTPFGVAALNIAFATGSETPGGPRVRLVRLDDPADSVVEGDFRVLLF